MPNFQITDTEIIINDYSGMLEIQQSYNILRNDKEIAETLNYIQNTINSYENPVSRLPKRSVAEEDFKRSFKDTILYSEFSSNLNPMPELFHNKKIIINQNNYPIFEYNVN